MVHIHHGIGRFTGMIRLPVDGVEETTSRYSTPGSDCLYVPATSLSPGQLKDAYRRQG